VTTPHLDALLALTKTVPQPEWASEVPAQVARWTEIVAGTSLGQWEIRPRPHADALAVLDTATKKRCRKWALLATGFLQHVVAGWSKPAGPVRVFLVDTESRHAREYAASIDQLVRFLVAEDPEAAEGRDALCAAVAAKVKESFAAPEAGGFSKTEERWYDPELLPPEATREKLKTKPHQRWLWHRAADVVVSLLPKGVRVLNANGKAKTLKHDFSTTSYHAALATDGTKVSLMSGSKLAILDLRTLEWKHLDVGWKSFCTGLGILGEHHVVAERFGLKDEVPRLRTFRVEGEELRDDRLLESEHLPDFPRLLGAAELPMVLVDCKPNPLTLVVELVDGLPTITGSAPHHVSTLKRSERGWRAGTTAAKPFSLVGA